MLALAAPNADALRLDAPAFYLAYWPYLVHETLYALLVVALGVMLQLGEPGASHPYSSKNAGNIQLWLLILANHTCSYVWSRRVCVDCGGGVATW